MALKMPKKGRFVGFKGGCLSKRTVSVHLDNLVGVALARRLPWDWA